MFSHLAMYAGLFSKRAEIRDGFRDILEVQGVQSGLMHAMQVVQLGDAHDAMLLFALARRYFGLVPSCLYELAANAYEKAFEDAPAMDLYCLAASLHWQQSCAMPADSGLRKMFLRAAGTALEGAARTGQQCVQSGRAVGFNLTLQVLANLKSLPGQAAGAAGAMRTVNAMASWDGLRAVETPVTLQDRQDAAQALAVAISQIMPQTDMQQALEDEAAQAAAAAVPDLCSRPPALEEYSLWVSWAREIPSELNFRQRCPAHNLHAIRCDKPGAPWVSYIPS